MLHFYSSKLSKAFDMSDRYQCVEVCQAKSEKLLVYRCVPHYRCVIVSSLNGCHAYDVAILCGDADFVQLAFKI